MALWRAALLLAAAPALRAQDEPPTCSAGGEPCRRSDEATAGQLRWRGFPYRVTNPRFAKTIYGGGYVKEAFKEHGFAGPVEGDDWHVLWTHRPQDRALAQLPALTQPGRRLVNHCSYFAAAGDKCSFTRHAEQVFRTLPGSPLHGTPYLRGFELKQPEELEQWRREVEAAPNRSWVLKPCSAGASKGIQVVRGAEALAAQAQLREPTVAQEYLERPFLGFGQRKFHMRVFVLVTSWEPVVARLYDNGVVFRSTHETSGEQAPSVERDVFSCISESVEGSQLEDLWAQLDAHGAAQPDPASALAASSAKVRERIATVLRGLLGTNLRSSFGSFKSLESARDFGCFDLLGADVMLDEQLQPMVMEINTGPNMWVDNHGRDHADLLYAIKGPMVKQVAHWASLRSSQVAVSEEEALAMEAEALVNFTRIL